jgi:hypothetical protein
MQRYHSRRISLGRRSARQRRLGRGRISFRRHESEAKPPDGSFRCREVRPRQLRTRRLRNLGASVDLEFASVFCVLQLTTPSKHAQPASYFCRRRQ